MKKHACGGSGTVLDDVCKWGTALCDDRHIERLERFGQVLEGFSRKELYMMIRKSITLEERIRMRATLTRLTQIDNGRHPSRSKIADGVSADCMGGIAPPKNIPGGLSAVVALETAEISYIMHVCNGDVSLCVCHGFLLA